MSTIYGIDVSKWQASINWQTVKSSGKVDYTLDNKDCDNDAHNVRDALANTLNDRVS